MAVWVKKSTHPDHIQGLLDHSNFQNRLNTSIVRRDSLFHARQLSVQHRNSPYRSSVYRRRSSPQEHS